MNMAGEATQTKGFWTVVYDGWLLFAELVGRFNTKIIVSIIYFLLVSVAWLLTSTCLKKQLLDRAFRIANKSAWVVRTEDKTNITAESLRHQF